MEDSFYTRALCRSHRYDGVRYVYLLSDISTFQYHLMNTIHIADMICIATIENMRDRVNLSVMIL